MRLAAAGGADAPAAACCICMEAPTHHDDTLVCPEGHAVCAEDLSQLVLMSAQPERLRRERTAIACPGVDQSGNQCEHR